MLSRVVYLPTLFSASRTNHAYASQHLVIEPMSIARRLVVARLTYLYVKYWSRGLCATPRIQQQQTAPAEFGTILLKTAWGNRPSRSGCESSFSLFDKLIKQETGA
jgi:hypothetical protein